MNLITFWQQGDFVIRFVALALLALSVSTWVVIVWKWGVLRRVQRDVPQSIAAFWQAAQFDDALQRVSQFDRDQCVQPMLAALQTAQKRLAKVPQPRLAPVLRAIQHDIERLQSTSTTDIPGLLIRLDELVVLVENLSLLNAVGHPGRPVQTPPNKPMPAWYSCSRRLPEN
mgnify:CR=1 FL=1